MFEAVIFDWDGTLADTQEVLLTSFKKALESINYTVDDQQIKRRIGIGVIETFKELLNDQDKSYDDKLLMQLLEIKVQTEINLSNKIPLFPGAKELLNALNGKTKIALASMNQRRYIDHILKEKNIQDFFSITLTANEVTQPKPNPEIFLKTAKQLEVVPEKCIVLEDSIFGVKAAIAAKMGCIAIAQGAYSANELLAVKPGLVVTSLKEKNDILNFIFSKPE